MALVVNDRVQQTGTANTTVSFTLSGSVTGYQSFSVIGNGNTTFYGATDTTGNWEVGIGTYATGGTLTRTTILASSNSGSAVTFSGTVNIFVTYPAEKSVNLDGSGNVSALGTIASGTWQGSTVGVAYGGTGVTTSSGANSVVLRDANQNVTANNFLAGYNVITAAGTTTTLTVASAYYQRISGSTTQTIKLPDATTMVNGQGFTFDNDSSGAVSIIDNASGAVDTVPSGGYSYIFVENNSTSAGSWGKYALIPASYDFSTTTADFGTATIINTTYNGNTVGTGYGGTGLTTFAAANNALYSTSSSALAAGTLPIAAGGTAGTTAATAFNNLSPITTTGDLIIGTGTNTAGRLGIGTSGYVLQSNGTTASWASPPGSSTLNIQDFTATSGQTSFTLTYTVGLVEGVYRNGIKLGQADYTATSGTAIVLGTGAIVGDLIQVVYFTAVAVTNVVNTFSAGTTGFTPSTATTGAVTLAGTLNVANGGTGSTTSTGSGSVVLQTSPTLVTPVLGTPTSVTLTNATGLPIGGISATGTPSSSTYLRGDGAWSTVVSGASLSNDTSTASNLYPIFAAATTGTPTTIYTSNAKYLYKPSTGELQASELVASNGLVVNNATVSTSYTVASGTNAISVGPITIASGISVTVSSGQRWVVL